MHTNYIIIMLLSLSVSYTGHKISIIINHTAQPVLSIIINNIMIVQVAIIVHDLHTTTYYDHTPPDDTVYADDNARFSIFLCMYILL